MPSVLTDVPVVRTTSVPAKTEFSLPKMNNGTETKRLPVTMAKDTNGHEVKPYIVWDQPLGTIKPIRMIAIGAGASGINLAYQTKNFLKNVELVVYEKNPDVGGTWYENRYPGCKCDIRE